jgi:two-component system cell cycle response regulator
MTAKVLVVDDLLPNIRLLEAKLKAEYYEVVTAQSGREAIDIANEVKPDIILLDVMMPEMDGFETCRHLKKDPRTSDIPVVMVTALSDVEDRVQGLNSGADDFLTKPINDLALFARIRSLARLKSMTDELRLRDEAGAEFGLSDEINEQVSSINDATIMVIDDDQAEAQQIARKLQEIGMVVHIHSQPIDAIKQSEELELDLIIVSTRLANDDGLHLCAHLRSQEKTRNTPLLILIEDDDTDLLVKGLDMGINDYLMTPIDSNEVVARVNIQVRRKRYQDALKDNQQRSISMSVTDSLTGLYNRRYFDTYMERILMNSLEAHKDLAVAIVDIDYFKKVNDGYGHLSGDDILRQVSELIVSNIRPTDLAVRYGGEEFVIVMPDTNINNAADVAERLRKRVSETTFKIPAGDGTLECSISVGVTSLVADDSIAVLIERADKALYHVKQTGRNRVAIYCGASQ